MRRHNGVFSSTVFLIGTFTLQIQQKFSLLNGIQFLTPFWETSPSLLKTSHPHNNNLSNPWQEHSSLLMFQWDIRMCSKDDVWPWNLIWIDSRVHRSELKKRRNLGWKKGEREKKHFVISWRFTFAFNAYFTAQFYRVPSRVQSNDGESGGPLPFTFFAFLSLLVHANLPWEEIWKRWRRSVPTATSCDQKIFEPRDSRRNDSRGSNVAIILILDCHIWVHLPIDLCLSCREQMPHVSLVNRSGPSFVGPWSNLRRTRQELSKTNTNHFEVEGTNSSSTLNTKGHHDPMSPKHK